VSSILGIPIPAAWSSAPLKHVTSMLSRGSAPDYVDIGAVRAISQASNQSTGLDWSRTRYHDFHGNLRNLKGLLQDDDVLINSTGTGTLGRVGYFSEAPDRIPCMADGHVTVARAKVDALDPRFGYYWIGSQPFQEYIYAALIVGATNQIELNRDRLGGAPVPLPPIDEQRRIADFLDVETARVDRLASARSAQLSLLDERERVALDEIFAKARSGAATRLKYLFSVRPRYGVLVPQFVDSGVPFIRVNDLLDLDGRAPGLRMIPATLSAQYARTVVKPGDLLISVVGTLGRSAIASELVAGANIARAVCSVRVAADVEVELVRAWLGTTSFRNQAVDATSTDTAQPTLGMEDLANFTFEWPTSSQERRSLVKSIDSARSALARLRQGLDTQRDLLAERRQVLITAAVTGQFDVSTASGRGVDV